MNKIKASQFTVLCSTVTLIFDYITCKVVTDFIRINNNNTLIYNYPNTIEVQHSDSSKQEIVYENYEVDSSNKVVYSFAYYYLLAGDYSITINAKTSYINGTLKTSDAKLVQNFSITESNL